MGKNWDDDCSQSLKVQGTRQGPAPEGDAQNLRDATVDKEVTNDRGGASQISLKAPVEGHQASCNM